VEDVAPPSEFGDWIPDGYQVKRARRPKKRVPEWANDDEEMKRRLVGPAVRVWHACNLYWRLGLTAREVAGELRTSEGAVRQIIHRVTRMAARRRVTKLSPG